MIHENDDDKSTRQTMRRRRDPESVELIRDRGSYPRRPHRRDRRSLHLHESIHIHWMALLVLDVQTWSTHSINADTVPCLFIYLFCSLVATGSEILSLR